MVYYTIYIKNLHNGTGYIDIGLESDQLLKDYLIFLDVGIKTHKTYPLASPGGSKEKAGDFVINLSEIAAITVVPPKAGGAR